jgi:hypothetical protein
MQPYLCTTISVQFPNTQVAAIRISEDLKKAVPLASKFETLCSNKFSKDMYELFRKLLRV